MAILLSNEILDSIKKELQHAESSVRIITAYCKASTFDYLNNCISNKVLDKKLLVRFRLDDILKGSTDFLILENGLQTGWDVYIRFDLHAKTYIVDNKRGLIGSANATNLGLSIGKNGNMEMATLVDVETKDVEKIDRLFADAIKVDSELVLKMKKQIDAINNSGMQQSFCWDSSITTMFNPHVETLFSYEMPDEFTLSVGEYFPFIDETYTGDIAKFKDSFRWSNAYMWLITTLKENDGCLYFGALSEKLHNAMVSDPKPYRRDIKNMLANLLLLIERLEMEEVKVDRPNYSQRIQLA